jgi:hypothetical protein
MRFLLVDLSFEDLLPISIFFVCGFQACEPPWET